MYENCAGVDDDVIKVKVAGLFSADKTRMGHNAK